MEKRVCAARMDDTVESVEDMLRSHQISSVPVIESKDTVIGIITSHDLVNFHAAGKDPKAVHAWQLCSYRPLKVAPQATIHEVAQLMLNLHIHHVLVAENDAIKGIVSSLDFVRLLVSQGDETCAS